MIAHKIRFNGEIWLIIPKLSVTPSYLEHCLTEFTQKPVAANSKKMQFNKKVQTQIIIMATEQQPDHDRKPASPLTDLKMMTR